MLLEPGFSVFLNGVIRFRFLCDTFHVLEAFLLYVCWRCPMKIFPFSSLVSMVLNQGNLEDKVMISGSICTTIANHGWHFVLISCNSLFGMFYGELYNKVLIGTGSTFSIGVKIFWMVCKILLEANEYIPGCL